MARRKKHVTYDSKETNTVLGLLSILLGIFFFISIFTVTENDSSLFAQTYNIFGQSTIVTSFFLFCFGFFFLGARVSVTKPPSIIAQLFLVFLIPGFLTSFANSSREIARLSGKDVPGGHVGYYIIKEIFGDAIPTEPATKLILFLAILIILPIAFSLSVSEIVEKLSKIINWLIKNVLVITSVNRGDMQSKMNKFDVIPEKAATFGDFNKLLQNKIQSNQKEKNEKRSEREEIRDYTEPIVPKLPNKVTLDKMGVEVKEGSVGEEGLKQESLKFPDWKLPPLSLLIPYKKTKSRDPSLEQNAKIIEKVLASFGVEAYVEDAYIGPSVVQYALNIPLGIRVSKIETLSENLALALGVDSKAVRIDSIPETTFLGIEVPRSNRELVRYKEIMESEDIRKSPGSAALSVPVGKDITGESLIGKIDKMPHLLIAGATGSGKSVLTNGFITGLIMTKTPDEVKLILVDPKQVEFSDYNGIPHLLTPVITDMDQVVNALKWCVGEMERRYSTLAKNQVRDIKSYNDKKGFAAMPYIVIVIDEMADMMMTANRNEAEIAIVRLAQKARAVGIHLILATQRPSVNVITGIIKANIPGRIGMSVTSSTDSRVILDRIGAESLMGHGDLLYKAPDKTKLIRLQAPFLEQEEVIRVVEFLKSQAPEVEYVTEILEKQLTDEEIAAANDNILGDISGDNLVEQAIRIVVQSGKGSASYLQRRLNIGFNRAARLLDELEEAGVVGPQVGSKPREVLISDADQFIAQLRGVQ